MWQAAGKLARALGPVAYPLTAKQHGRTGHSTARDYDLRELPLREACSYLADLSSDLKERGLQRKGCQAQAKGRKGRLGGWKW